MEGNGMIAILDAVYSAYILLILTPFVLLAVFIMIWMISPLQKIRLPLICRIIYFAIPIALYLALFQFPFGYSDSVSDMIISGDFLIFRDFRKDRRLPRLHAIDVNTGKLLYRTHFTEPPLFYRTHLEQAPELYSIQGSILFMRKGKDFCMYDIQNRKELMNYSYKNLMKNYDELSAGVETVMYKREYSTLTILGKNGRYMYLDPFSGKMHKEPVKQITLKDTEKYYLNYNSIFQKTDKSARRLIYLENIKNTHKTGVLRHEDIPIRNNGSHEFIDPHIILQYPESEIFIIRSLETLNSKKYILTAFTMNLQKLWQIKQSALGAGDLFTDLFRRDLMLFPWMKYQNTMIFAIGGFLFSIDARTGNLNWRNRF